MLISLSNLAGDTCKNSRAIEKPVSRLRDFTRSYDMTSIFMTLEYCPAYEVISRIWYKGVYQLCLILPYHWNFTHIIYDVQRVLVELVVDSSDNCLWEIATGVWNSLVISRVYQTRTWNLQISAIVYIFFVLLLLPFLSIANWGSNKMATILHTIISNTYLIRISLKVESCPWDTVDNKSALV